MSHDYSENKQKERRCEWSVAFVENAHNTAIFAKLPNNLVVPIYPITSVRERKDATVFPMRIAYANTIYKAQRQTLKKAILSFDVDTISPGAAYIALSRVRVLLDIYFLIAVEVISFYSSKQYLAVSVM